MTQRHVDLARAQLRLLLGQAIVLHPCADGEGRYLTAEVTGDYTGLMRLATGLNKSGGGQPRRTFFRPKNAGPAESYAG